jgi:hypothetical protein
MKKRITKKEIENIQHDWGEGVVEIGKRYMEKKDYVSAAKKHVGIFYGYAEGTVLFKPTKTAKIQFRTTQAGALSYFVGNNPAFDEDKGFALQPWTKVRFENTGLILNEDTAFAMGNYFFTDLKGTETKVEYTFGYFRSKNGDIKINIHHSSIPFSN